MKKNNINNIDELLEMTEDSRMTIGDYQTALNIKWLRVANISAVEVVDRLSCNLMATC